MDSTTHPLSEPSLYPHKKNWQYITLDSYLQEQSWKLPVCDFIYDRICFLILLYDWNLKIYSLVNKWESSEKKHAHTQTQIHIETSQQNIGSCSCSCISSCKGWNRCIRRTSSLTPDNSTKSKQKQREGKGERGEMLCWKQTENKKKTKIKVKSIKWNKKKWH